MTTQLNQTQILPAAQAEEKMPADHEPLSASTQRGSVQPSMSDGPHRSSSQLASAVAPPIPQHGLRSCIYIALRCSCCGDVRQAVTEPATHDTIACPECGRECSFVLLGSGLTKRNLPFHEVHCIEPTRWDQRSEVEIVPEGPAIPPRFL